MADTVQRLKDLLEISENKEVKLLTNIMKDYVVSEKKQIIGFKSELDSVKKEVESD